MGDIKGFMKHKRQDFSKEPVASRVKHWKEFIKRLSAEEMQTQGARCMDCGIPFCHWKCPLANYIPDWNDLIYQGQWQEAVKQLYETNNFPEFTGRVCPAPCEDGCVLSIDQQPVTIRNIELSIIEKAYEEGWITPNPPKARTGKTIAVVGSGPAGLACADQLNHYGHTVRVFEKNDDIGGLLVYGIPDFKLEKKIVQRRVDLMRKEGVVFKTETHIGKDIRIKYLQKEYDAVVLCGGAEQPRDLPIPGREWEGVYQAMEFLSQQNRVNKGQRIDDKTRIFAKGKHVVVLGGGDTGSDCVGTANRQGAASVKQFEILPCPPKERAFDNPWPEWALKYRKSSSQEEGVEQEYCILTKELIGENGKLKKIRAVRLEYGEKDPATGRRSSREVPGSEFEVDCDLLLLAMGFLGPVKDGLIEELDVALDGRGNIRTDERYMTSVKGVFAAGDMHRGQSLVVWAIDEGRSAALHVHEWLNQPRSMTKGN